MNRRHSKLALYLKPDPLDSPWLTLPSANTLIWLDEFEQHIHMSVL